MGRWPRVGRHSVFGSGNDICRTNNSMEGYNRGQGVHCRYKASLPAYSNRSQVLYWVENGSHRLVEGGSISRLVGHAKVASGLGPLASGLGPARCCHSLSQWHQDWAQHVVVIACRPAMYFSFFLARLPVAFATVWCSTNYFLY